MRKVRVAGSGFACAQPAREEATTRQRSKETRRDASGERGVRSEEARVDRGEMVRLIGDETARVPRCRGLALARSAGAVVKLARRGIGDFTENGGAMRSGGAREIARPTAEGLVGQECEG